TTTTADANAVGAQAAVGAGIAITVAPDTTTATTSRFQQAGGNVSFLASGTDSSSATGNAGTAGADSRQGNANGQIGSQLSYGNSVSGNNNSASSLNLPSASTGTGSNNNVGVAAALGLNVATSTVSATIPDGGHVTAGGTLTLSSSNTTSATAGADGSAAG